jgi:hypothetical protein
MGRPRKSARLLELQGAFDKNPQRGRDLDPTETRPLGDPPDRLPAKARPFWDEIARIVPAGCLRISDRWAVELASMLMAKMVGEPDVTGILEAVKTGLLTKAAARDLIKKASSISSAELSTLKSLLAALGMTPADRAKLSIPAEKPTNRFADLAKVN